MKHQNAGGVGAKHAIKLADLGRPRSKTLLHKFGARLPKNSKTFGPEKLGETRTQLGGSEEASL